MPESHRPKGIDKARLRRLVLDGLSDRAVADILGCTNQNVARHRRNFGLKPNYPCVRWSAADLARLLELRGTATHAEIGRQLGRPTRAVKDALRYYRRKERRLVPKEPK